MASSSTKYVAIVIAVVLAGGGGLFAGRYLAARRIAQVTAQPVAWKAGDVLPPVRLVSELGDRVSSQDLLAHGGVVLVLELECPPCIEMAQKWNQAISDGLVPVEHVIGITPQNLDAIAHFRSEGEIQFPVYQDADSALLSNGWVTSFPLEVIVGQGGRVVATSESSQAPIDERALQAAQMGAQ